MLLSYMLDERDLYKKEKPFKLGEYQLPKILDLVAQIEFLKVTLSNRDLIFYAKLPEAFSEIGIPDGFLDRHNRSLKKLETLLTLMENDFSANLEDSINQAVDLYRKANSEDFEGLEVLYVEGKLLISIYDGQNLAFQIRLKKEDSAWKIENCMTHFRLFGYNLEIRDNLNGNEVIILHPPIEDLGVIPQVRDYAAIASMKIPNGEDDDWNIKLFDVIEDPNGNEEITYHDHFTIAPVKKRQILMYDRGVITQQLFITETANGIELDMRKLDVEQTPDGYSEILTYYYTTSVDTIDLSAMALIEKVLNRDNMQQKQTIINKKNYGLSGKNLSKYYVSASRIEYFDEDRYENVQVTYSPDQKVQTIEVDGIVYGPDEFSAQITPDAYCVFTIHSTMQRIPVFFESTYGITLADEEVRPVFEVINHQAGYSVSNLGNLGNMVSLN